MNKRFLVIFLAVLTLSLATLFAFWSDVRNILIEQGKPEVPPEVSYTPQPSPKATAGTATPKPSSLVLQVVGAINLAVPFSAQAPKGDWSLPYQEACEEISAILVHRFYARQGITPDEAVSEIWRTIDWQNKNFGYYEHTTAAQTAQMIKAIYGYKKVEVLHDITMADIFREVRAGRPVIVPLAGRLLGNPYYKNPGPVYHMLIVKGVTADGRVITNDVGTRHGHNYVYDADVFFNAIHDVPTGGSTWPPGVDPATYILSGRRAMIVVYPN